MLAIETRNLTKYYGKFRGIEDINLEIGEGEIFGFIGPNGAGKSTTIRTLLSLIYPTSGSGRIFDMDIIKNSKEIKKNIGFMPSEVNYYDKMSGRELLEYSARFYKKAYKGRIDKLAEYFDVDLEKKIFDLSLGNKKKLSILQSLIHKPKLLILDEPTGGLDPLMQAKFFDMLKEENKRGVTIFFSSHILSEVQKFCRRVAIIKEGKIIKVEDIETLRKKELKRVFLELSSGRNNFDIEGAVDIKREGQRLNFLYSGDINKLIHRLSAEALDNLEIEEPTLEEIFMHYYEAGEANND